MKRALATLFQDTVTALVAAGRLPPDLPAPEIARPRQGGHGDFATNFALAAAKAAGRSPRALAEELKGALGASPLIDRIEIAGPGFLNVFVARPAFHEVVRAILREKEAYGRLPARPGKTLLEFVSANPNGPLHVGHGRGAAYGDSLARLLACAGYAVEREYYVNDAGRQMDILALSVWLRYMQASGHEVVFPETGYRGAYVADIAQGLARAWGDRLERPISDILIANPDLDADALMDNWIARLKEALGRQYETVHGFGLNAMLADIKDDLAAFGVQYDRWYSERGLVESGAVDRALQRLRASNDVYEKDGALWFRASRYGDEKDRVVVRENGAATYFASDIAYHLEKCERGYTDLIDIWGADHHGYVPRVKGALAALGEDPNRLQVLLVQFAILYRGGQRAQMSTRSGDFVTLRELRAEVGNDAARFFYVLRKSEQHMDFDLDLAKSQSNDNPVYYVQYAHARVCSVFRQLRERGLTPPDLAQADLGVLNAPEEHALERTLARYIDVVDEAAGAREPHQIAYYLRELAGALHAYYNAHAFLGVEAPLRDARLALITAARVVLANGLALLGVSAPEAM
ncbi:arginine--tRNA ligase [Acidiferrobacter sp.]|uniref:arginine--tRNA ligase n=1 Tax=Acidiferrobacter sp. TaxID=1872107 RepID=UPI0026204FBF|nr:arginine--tRNA ligase [Acidiferrobacter sp.]